jgi:predicted transposase/invertase (TIGR01784 family)
MDIVKEIVEEAVEKAVEQAVEKALQAGRQEVAEKMFRKGLEVSDVVDITGLSVKDAEEIRSNLH